MKKTKTAQTIIGRVMLLFMIFGLTSLAGCANNSADNEIPDPPQNIYSPWDEYYVTLDPPQNEVTGMYEQISSMFSYEENEQPVAELFIRGGIEYDYAIVSVSATSNITLESELTYTVDYSSEQQSVPINFSTVPTFEGIALNYWDVTVDYIQFDVDAYKDNEKVETDRDRIYILAAPDGIFVYNGVENSAYYSYITYLFENAKITEIDYKRAIQSIHRHPDNEANNSEVDTQLIEDGIIIEQNENSENLNETSIETQATTPHVSTVNFFYIPTVSVSFSVMPWSSTQAKVSGTVTWADVEQNS